MSIQEISISNNQKKQLLKSKPLEAVLFEDDNGDLVVNVAAYQSLSEGADSPLIESILGDDVLDFNQEYFVFS